ncbi:AcvB/VirJ family lysyl-phosphatidylglycerol hydrolase [Pararhodospirillum photometricum]|uniref:AcvB/VirJ family lysyl-phosphatidylglycerol hydrolase n=1 Tax=Pararhodospirillum photometricum TaxID=1084 RepID=UPI0002E0ED62|nr:AcvB/VirJ family lysyl-phosphatidylglycerol hydrolase [Pararhodospirillum photometricum]
MRAIVPLLVLCLICGFAHATPLPPPDPPPLPDPPFSLPPAALTVFQPAGPPQSVVVLFSDARWGTRERALATRWQRQGALVVGLDTPALLAHINTAEPGDCTDLANTLEGYSQDLQKALAVDPYLSPILAGTGTGGALALATMAGADVNTYGAAVVVDPAAVVPAQASVCRRENDPPLPALAYGFTAQDDPVRVLLTPTAPPETRRLIRALTRPLPAIRTVRVSLPPDEALARRVSRLLANRSGIADAALVPLPATASRDLMAIVLSGDGGWRDLDREIALQFQKEGRHRSRRRRPIGARRRNRRRHPMGAWHPSRRRHPMGAWHRSRPRLPMARHRRTVWRTPMATAMAMPPDQVRRRERLMPRREPRRLRLRCSRV